MPARYPDMIALGYGVYVRADRIVAVVPLPGGERGEKRRTLVHVDGLDEPLVASRSERAIIGDLVAARAELLDALPSRRRHTRRRDDDPLF